MTDFDFAALRLETLLRHVDHDLQANDRTLHAVSDDELTDERIEAACAASNLNVRQLSVATSRDTGVVSRLFEFWYA